MGAMLKALLLKSSIGVTVLAGVSTVGRVVALDVAKGGFLANRESYGIAAVYSAG